MGCASEAVLRLQRPQYCQALMAVRLQTISCPAGKCPTSDERDPLVLRRFRSTTAPPALMPPQVRMTAVTDGSCPVTHEINVDVAVSING